MLALANAMRIWTICQYRRLQGRAPLGRQASLLSVAPRSRIRSFTKAPRHRLRGPGHGTEGLSFDAVRTVSRRSAGILPGRGCELLLWCRKPKEGHMASRTEERASLVVPAEYLPDVVAAILAEIREDAERLEEQGASFYQEERLEEQGASFYQEDLVGAAVILRR